MKKKSKRNQFPDFVGKLRKLACIMKLTFLLILVNVFVVFSNTYSQQTKLTISGEDVCIRDVLLDVESKSEFRFFFNNDLVDLDQHVDYHVEKGTIIELLDQILSKKGIQYEVVDRTIILSPKTVDNQIVVIQTINSIKGIVTDSAGQPLPGVTVVVKGTINGTITNFDGVYTLSDVPSDGIIQFSFVGMKMQEIPVAGKTSINVTMVDEAIGIDEVVAVGYGTMKKHEVTGAVTQANLERYKDVSVTNVLESIKGSVPGLNVGGINTAGEVGSIIIRGQNSTAASNTPLIVLDGAIFNGSIGDIPSNDIESLTVLKDASAAAIYGSRSANGVIIIETKSGFGVNGKPKFDVKVSYGINNQLKPLEVYGKDGYLQRVIDTREAQGYDADPELITSYLTTEEAKNYNATSDHQATLTNPFSLFSQLGNTLNSSFSISNSTDKTKYYISTSFVNQKGVIIYDEYKHISGRINIESDLTNWFNLGIKSLYSLRDYSGDSPSLSYATHLGPYATIYNEDGSYKKLPHDPGTLVNPFWTIATEDADIRNNLNGIIIGKIKVPWIKGLSYQVTYSNTISWNESFQFWDENTVSGASNNGIGERSYDRSNSMLLDNLLKYNNTFSDKHNVGLTFLFSREHSEWENIYAYAEDFTNTKLGSYALENGDIQLVETGGGETNGIGMMARANYTYNHKYSITGTVRRDGYSAFSKNKKWGVFPSVGFNWFISREGFMEDINPVNNLSLRVSYGKNGNQSIDAYGTLAQVAIDNYLLEGSSGTYSTITQYISSLANDNLGWESTTGLNAGIDFTLLNNKIKGSIDVYNTKTNDLMFDMSLPAASGMSTITANVGEIKNKGFELSLHTLNLDRGNFKWHSDFAFSLNRNKVVSILGEDNDGDGIEDDLISDGYFIGRSLGTIYDYKVIGMWQQEDEDNGTIMSGMRPGDYMLEDMDEDGAITSDQDRQFLGTENPNFRWSWTHSLDYKGFNLMFYLYSIWGGNNYYLSGNNDPYNDATAGNPNANHPIYDYWTPTHTDAKYPRTDYVWNAPYQGTKYVNRSFIKLQKVSLSYNASRLVKQYGINGMSLSLSADNLFTYAPHWEGLDPETDNGLTDTSRPSIRTYLLTLSFNF